MNYTHDLAHLQKQRHWYLNSQRKQRVRNNKCANTTWDTARDNNTAQKQGSSFSERTRQVPVKLVVYSAVSHMAKSQSTWGFKKELTPQKSQCYTEVPWHIGHEKILASIVSLRLFYL